MHALYVQKKKIVDRVNRIHGDRVRSWKENGAKGLKPKLYRTVEDIFTRGLDHPDFSDLEQPIDRG